GKADVFRADFSETSFPVKALQFLETHQLTNRVFTSDWFGSYLIYALYPNARVFVDGRSVSFYDNHISELFLDMLNARPGWEKPLDEYGIETVLLPVQVNLASVLKESDRWKPVYDDGFAIVFRRSTAPELPDSRTSSVGAILTGRVHGQSAGNHQN